MNYVKSIIAAIPLVVGLAGPSMAAIAESGDAGGLNAEPVSIESLLNRYTGLVPGDHDSESDLQSQLPSERLSAFTRATAPMSSGYTVMGSDRSIFSSTENDQFGRGHGVTNGDAAAPAFAAITVAHFVQDSLVSAVNSGITPTSSSGSSPTPANTSTPPDGPVLTTTIIPTATPVPLPPALFMFGSGLAFLAPIRNRLQAKSI